MAPPARSEPPRVAADSDVLIAGLFSTRGASHALLVLAELGLVALVVPALAVEEVRRNLTAKLPEALPAFERLLEALAVVVHDPAREHLEAAAGRADPKDRPILAAALGSGARWLMTHNVRHFRGASGVRVLRPSALLEEVRDRLARLGE